MREVVNKLSAAARRLLLHKTLVSSVVTAALLLALLGGALTVRAQGGSAGAKAVPNIVLVHGFWADASSWSGVIKLLQAQGYNVTAVQLPLRSLADDVARVRSALAMQTGPTLVVAHSYGGAVITDLGKDAPNAVGLVYVAAFSPDRGETLGGIIGQGEPPAFLAHVKPDNAGYLYFDMEGFTRYFAAGIAPAEARVLQAEQKPPFAGINDEVIGTPAWKSLPSWYLLSQDDLIIPPAGQQAMAMRMGAKITSIPSGHLSLISHADTVAQLVEQAAETIGGGAPAAATVVPSPVAVPGTGSQLFEATGKTVRGKFLDYWNAHGGLAQFGYPISDEITETSPTDGKPYTVQYFERAEFELHPENGAPFDVQLALLGSLRYKTTYPGR